MKKISEDKILSFIEENLDVCITVNDIAENFGYSSDHFRHLFRTRYNVSLGEYMRRRRLVGAAKKIQIGESVGDAAARFGFETPAGFAKAFRKEFGIAASELKGQNDIFLDEFPEPFYDKSLIKVSYMETSEIKMAGKSLIPKREYGHYDMDNPAFWMEDDSLDLNQKAAEEMNKYPDDILAMWYHDPEDMHITYVLGPVVKNFDNLPEGWIPITIPGRKYAIFETKKENDRKQMAETIRMLGQYVFWEWEPVNDKKKDKMGFTFERYRGNKAAIYMPVL